jgi:hypothetical protein
MVFLPTSSKSNFGGIVLGNSVGCSSESSEQRQWDHPKFIELKHLLDDCNYVKYSKYRVALKFRVLQKALFMEQVSLKTVIGVFGKHQLGINESSLCLESYDLEAVLFDIYFAANKQNQTNVDADFAVELMQNFLYNIYDKYGCPDVTLQTLK